MCRDTDAGGARPGGTGTPKPPEPAGPGQRPAAGPTPPIDRRTRLLAYVALTKPRIIELLLVTTLPAMILAAHGLPDLETVIATLVGGTLAAGSANALNCYVDRDIDEVMRRTGKRPLARHVVTPRAALIFGLRSGRRRRRRHGASRPTCSRPG